MKNNKKGFTLIEMLVVVLIIGILAAIALPQYTLAVEKAKATEALINIKTIINEVGKKMVASGIYDDTIVFRDPETWDIELSGGTWYDSGCCGPMFVTDNFIYLIIDNGSESVDVYRCIGKCTQASIDEPWLYYISGYYPYRRYSHPNFECGTVDDNDKGKKICKALEGLGIENIS